jgi:hypothetical protein
MKNIILITLISVLVISFTGCGEMGGKYADAKAVLNKMIEINDHYVKDLEAVESAADYVKALNKYADAMEKLKPKMEAVAKKYPEMKGQATPEELKPLVEKMGQSMQAMMTASMKMMKYAEDPEVMKATQRLQSAMAGPAAEEEPTPEPVETPTEPAEPQEVDTTEEATEEPAETAETPATDEAAGTEEPVEAETPEAVEAAPESPSAPTPAASTEPATPSVPKPTPVEKVKETPPAPKRPKKAAVPKPLPPPPPPSNTVMVVTAGGSEKLEALGFYTEAAFPGVFKDKFQLVEGGSPAYHLVIDAKSMGTSQLSHYGSTTTQYSLNIRMKMVDVKTGKIVSGPFSRTVKYTQLNEEDNLKEGIRIMLSKLMSGLKN